MKVFDVSKSELLLILSFLVILAMPIHAQTAACHILHVLNDKPKTIEEAGFLHIALAEAATANLHARYAAGSVDHPRDLRSMQTHAGHVLHAVDPTQIENGPGFGYGLKQAAEKIIHHMEAAAAATDASEAVRAHAKPVMTIARKTIERAGQIVSIIRQIQAADSAVKAAPHAHKLEILTGELNNGIEGADGSAEGLWQAKHHIKTMLNEKPLQCKEDRVVRDK